MRALDMLEKVFSSNATLFRVCAGTGVFVFYFGDDRIASWVEAIGRYAASIGVTP